MHPFLDVGKLTDEEIIEKIGKAYQFMNMQKQMGHSPTVHSIQEVIQSLEDERENRLLKSRDDEYKRKFTKELEPIELGKLED